MTLLTPSGLRAPLATGTSALPMLPTTRGWIGIDMGTSSMKLAQVQRHDGEWHIAHRWLLPYPSSMALTPETLSESKLATFVSELQQIGRSFRGRRSAAALSMSLTEYRTLEIPRGDQREMACMIREELLADKAERDHEWEFDFWDTNDPPEAGDELARVAVVAAAPAVVQQVFKTLSRAGLELQVLDGLPCALARAVPMADRRRSEAPVVALELGYSAASFSLIVNHRPVFARVLRGCGVESFLQPLHRELHLSRDECQHLLANFGIAVPNEEATNSATARATTRLLATPLDKLLTEVARTLSYVNQQYRKSVPEGIWLFGGGAMIHRLPELIQSRLNLPVRPWTLPTSGGAAPKTNDALFGVAAALSALAWEARACI